MHWRVGAHRSHSQLFLCLVLGSGHTAAASTQPDLLNVAKQLECAQNAQQATSALQSYKNINLPKLPLPNEWFDSDKPPALHAASLDITLHVLSETSKRFPELALDVEQVVLQWGYCEVFLDNTFYDFITKGGQLNRLLAESTSPINWDGFRAMGFLGDHKDRFVIDAFKHDDAPFVFYEVDYSIMFRTQCLPHPQTSKLFFDSETYFPWRVVHDGYKNNERYPYDWQAGCAVDETAQVTQVQNTPDNEADKAVDTEADTVDVLAAVDDNVKAAGSNDSVNSIDASDASKTTNEDFELDSSNRHELTPAERELLIARRMVGYRYEITELQKSVRTVATGPGYYYFTVPLRPQQPGDGIADYVSPKKMDGPLVDGIADYIDPQRAKPNTKSRFAIDSPVSDDDKRALLASASELGQRWLNDVRNQSYGYRRPRPGIVRSSTRDTAEDSEQAKEPELAAQNVVPVIIDEGGVAPIVVFNPEPEPIEEVSEPEPLRTKKKKKYRGLNGFITLGNRGFDSDGFSITAGASYKPIKESYWFARTSWNYRFDDEEFRYTWGIGYDDWHPGTWAVQLNHWGPLLPGDYLDIDNAVASITYKFNKNNFMTKNRIASSVTLSQKISGDPVFSWSNSWSPKGKWFVRSTVSQPVKGGDSSWSYGFGYTDYSPFSFSFEYNNWGYNKAFEYNFKDNASLSMTYRWRY